MIKRNEMFIENLLTQNLSGSALSNSVGGYNRRFHGVAGLFRGKNEF
jgi:hypothetical protein